MERRDCCGYGWDNHRDQPSVPTRRCSDLSTRRCAVPEQVRGEAVTTLTDVYSLGVVLFEVVTGHKPYRLRRHSDAEWERSILDVQVPRASTLLLPLADHPGPAPRPLPPPARPLRCAPHLPLA